VYLSTSSVCCVVVQASGLAQGLAAERGPEKWIGKSKGLWSISHRQNRPLFGRTCAVVFRCKYHSWLSRINASMLIEFTWVGPRHCFVRPRATPISTRLPAARGVKIFNTTNYEPSACFDASNRSDWFGKFRRTAALRLSFNHSHRLVAFRRLFRPGESRDSAVKIFNILVLGCSKRFERCACWRRTH